MADLQMISTGIPERSTVTEDTGNSSCRPANAIETKRVEITVKSSFYQLEEQIPTCTVVLDISFYLGGDMGLAHASVPLDLRLYEILPESSAPAPASLKALHPEFYLHDVLTGPRAETIVMERYETHENTSLMPNLELGVASVTGKFSNVGKTQDHRRVVEKAITLVGQSFKNNMQVKWTFGNESRKRYPPTVRLLITVKKTRKSQNPHFPFFLALGEDFMVSVFGESLKDKIKTLFRKSRPEPIQITGDWETEIAQKALTDITRFQNDRETPQHIGLRAARGITVLNQY